LPARRQGGLLEQDAVHNRADQGERDELSARPLAPFAALARATHHRAEFASVPSWMGSAGVRASHWLSEKAIWMPFEGAMRKARREALALRGEAKPSLGSPVLYGFSPKVIPVPTSTEQRRIVTGY